MNRHVQAEAAVSRAYEARKDEGLLFALDIMAEAKWGANRIKLIIEAADHLRDVVIKLTEHEKGATSAAVYAVLNYDLHRKGMTGETENV